MSFNRRDFIKTAGMAVATAALPVNGNAWAFSKKQKNPLPAWRGFNLLDFFSPQYGGGRDDMNDQHSPGRKVPGEVYRKVALAAAVAIRKHNPHHLVIADGNNVGNDVIPEITGLDIAQSCRGYYPHAISHYQAPWANKNPELCPVPVWPGKIGDSDYSRDDLEEYYQPWIELSRNGTGVHCGECGCWKNTPHPVFLSWFGDVTGILANAGIGFALWNFRGDFGILDSGRKDVAYEEWHGHQLDRKLLDLLQQKRG